MTGNKDFQELKLITAEGNSFPKMIVLGLNIIFLTVASYLISSLSSLAQSIAKGKNLSTVGFVTRNSDLFKLLEIFNLFPCIQGNYKWANSFLHFFYKRYL